MNTTAVCIAESDHASNFQQRGPHSRYHRIGCRESNTTGRVRVKLRTRVLEKGLGEVSPHEVKGQLFGKLVTLGVSLFDPTEVNSSVVESVTISLDVGRDSRSKPKYVARYVTRRRERLLGDRGNTSQAPEYQEKGKIYRPHQSVTVN